MNTFIVDVEMHLNEFGILNINGKQVNEYDNLSSDMVYMGLMKGYTDSENNNAITKPVLQVVRCDNILGMIYAKLKFPFDETQEILPSIIQQASSIELIINNTIIKGFGI